MAGVRFACRQNPHTIPGNLYGNLTDRQGAKSSHKFTEDFVIRTNFRFARCGAGALACKPNTKVT